jgi:hypothetical protein
VERVEVVWPVWSRSAEVSCAFEACRAEEDSGCHSERKCDEHHSTIEIRCHHSRTDGAWWERNEDPAQRPVRHREAEDAASERNNAGLREKVTDELRA